MNLSIVIPNYNGEKLLKKNLPKVLEAVKEYKKGKIEIIIADDPSTDNSSQVIKEFTGSIKDKHIIGKTISNKNKREAGFSKNVNRGVSLATGEILILLNSDVSPHRDFLTALLSHFSDPKIFAVGCMDESREGDKTVLRGRGIGRWNKGFLMHKKGSVDKENTLWVSGGSGAFRMSIWNKLRGLDNLYNPFYWEDIDLSYRALKSGYKIYFESKSIVVHEHEKGAIISKFKPMHIQKIAYRNQFIFVWKNITDWQLVFSHIFWLPYHLLNALRRKDWAFVAGFYLAVANLSQIMRSREQAHKLFLRTDKQVIKEQSE
ncbi:glycosyltransferase family 2 protein [Candidatus Roizmanbacteria bacterium]|nr:glycosyltransferase family 2 protein [Candidatus Roizmanbacteria bacterium]